MDPRCSRMAFGLSVLFFSSPLLAQATPSLDPVVVTATRTPVSLTDVLADVSWVDRDQIDRMGAASVAEVLARLPGITLSQAGGPASTTGVFIRGADSRFTAVFMDGVRVDTQSGDGGAPWEAIPLTQVDRIEVLRGPAAAVYGSDAIGGVVQIFTREGEQGFHPSVRLGAGTYGTREANASLRGGVGDVTYSLGLAKDQSDGFDARPGINNPDRDGYQQQSFSGRVGLKFLPGQRLELTVLDNDQKADYDSTASSSYGLANHHLQLLGVLWSSRWSDEWTTKMSFTRGSDRYESFMSTTFTYLTKTQVNTYLFQNEYRLGPGLMTAAFERREDALQNTDTSPSTDTSRYQNAVALGYGFKTGDHALQVNARHDDDSEFGGKSTGSLAYGYALSTAWRATASTGTAFRVPTLYQRFSSYGSSSLKAETSTNQELGLRWLSGPHQASLLAYQNQISNLSDFVFVGGSCSSPDGCYANTGRARLTGVTLAGNTLWGNVHVAGSLDWMDPRNLDTQKQLARRPHQQATVSAHTMVRGWQMGAEIQSAGERYDDASNTSRLAPYTLIHLSASHALDRDWQMRFKVNNLTNQDYTLAKGYATPGRSFFLILTWTPQR